MTATTTETRPYLWDGVRAMRTELIETGYGTTGHVLLL